MASFLGLLCRARDQQLWCVATRSFVDWYKVRNG